MKTEQEQIKAIKQIIDERVETTLCYVQGRHGNVIKTVDTVIIARDIVNAGYGDVSEYKAEIERLRQEVRDTDKIARNSIEQYKSNYDNAFERLKAQEREIEMLKAKSNEQSRKSGILGYNVTVEFHDDEVSEHSVDYKDIEKYAKQFRSRIITINEKEKKQAKIDVLNKLKKRARTSYVLDDFILGSVVFSKDIDELIKEVQNGEDNG